MTCYLELTSNCYCSKRFRERGTTIAQRKALWLQRSFVQFSACHALSFVVSPAAPMGHIWCADPYCGDCRRGPYACDVYRHADLLLVFPTVIHDGAAAQDGTSHRRKKELCCLFALFSLTWFSDLVVPLFKFHSLHASEGWKDLMRPPLLRIGSSRVGEELTQQDAQQPANVKATGLRSGLLKMPEMSTTPWFVSLCAQLPADVIAITHIYLCYVFIVITNCDLSHVFPARPLSIETNQLFRRTSAHSPSYFAVWKGDLGNWNILIFPVYLLSSTRIISRSWQKQA